MNNDAAKTAGDSTHPAIDSSRQIATAAASKIMETSRELRDTAAGRRLANYATAGRDYVAREPWNAALIAAGIGAAAAGLILVLLRTRNDEPQRNARRGAPTAAR